MTLVYGNKPLYGIKVGILMMDYLFPRPCGDIGNARSFNYPILYEVVENFNLDSADDATDCLIAAAQRLEKKGVKIIFASCGLLLSYQKLISETLNIPVCLSSLVMLPMIQQIIGFKKKVAIIMSRESINIKNMLTETIGLHKDSYVIAVMNNCPEFVKGIDDPKEPYQFDTDLVELEILHVCDDVLEKHNDIGAFLLECTNMGPYSEAIRKHTRLPVFDIISVINMMQSAFPEE